MHEPANDAQPNAGDPASGVAGPRPGGAGLGAVAVGIVTAILPVFLLSSLSFQIREDLGYGEATAGLVLAAFFASSAAVSSRLGRWVDVVGPRQAMQIALTGTTVLQLLFAVVPAVPAGAVALGVLSAAAGVCNATAQLGANVFIGRDLPLRRQGIGFAVKQSAMPGASLVAGLTLPVIALPLGWRWVFALAAPLTIASLSIVRSQLPASPPLAASGAGAPALPSGRAPRGLVPMAVAAAFATGAAITLGGFFVESAIHAGVDPGTAGVIFSLGSVVSILVRLGVGAIADRRRGDMLGAVAVMLAIGSLTSAWFTLGTPAAHLIGVPLAFGTGWAWPGLFNLSVVRAAPGHPGRATGITQTGTYLGGAIGPILFGTVAESVSFDAAWWLAAALGLAAAGAVLLGRRSLHARR